MRQEHPDLEVGTGIAVLVFIALVLLVALVAIASGEVMPRRPVEARDCGHDETCPPDECRLRLERRAR